MIPSYYSEILRKRRGARIFWCIVFIASVFLYFFFQGYYPDVKLGLKRILSESGTTTHSGVSDLIRSFGIINIATIPSDATITLGSGTYTTNEKRMSDYGTYHMSISKNGYLSNQINFMIDREKPYLIEKISLLSTPVYQKKSDIKDVYRVSDDTYILRTASGIIWYGSTMSGQVNLSGSLEHIGGVYFRNNTNILQWNTNKFISPNPAITNYIKTCPRIQWVSGLFSCPQIQSILTEEDQYMTGVTDISHDLIIQSGSIWSISDGSIKKIQSQTGTIDLSRISLIEDELYDIMSGSLVSKDKKDISIETPLDHIVLAQSQGDDILILGSKGEKKYLIIRHIGDPIDRDRMIELPAEIDAEHTMFHTLLGNLIIETPTSLLLIYRGSTDIHWLVDGEILSYSSTGAYYRKDGAIWWADWSGR